MLLVTQGRETEYLCYQTGYRSEYQKIQREKADKLGQKFIVALESEQDRSEGFDASRPRIFIAPHYDPNRGA